MSQTLVFIHVVAVAIFVGGGGLLLMLDPSRTVLAAGPDKGGVRFRLTAGQVAVSQRIGQAAIRRLRLLQDRLEAGLADADFRAASLTAADLG